MKNLRRFCSKKVEMDILDYFETVKLDRGFMMCPGGVGGANELGFMDTDGTRQGSLEEFLKQCIVFPSAYF